MGAISNKAGITNPLPAAVARGGSRRLPSVRR